MCWKLNHVNLKKGVIRPVGKSDDFAVVMGLAARDAGHDLIWRSADEPDRPNVQVMNADVSAGDYYFATLIED